MKNKHIGDDFMHDYKECIDFWNKGNKPKFVKKFDLNQYNS